MVSGLCHVGIRFLPGWEVIGFLFGCCFVLVGMCLGSCWDPADFWFGFVLVGIWLDGRYFLTPLRSIKFFFIHLTKTIFLPLVFLF